MSKRHCPPTRMSISFVSIANPSGPNHAGNCAGSVQASNTRARGASTTRVMTISRSRGHSDHGDWRTLVGSLMVAGLLLAALNVGVHPVKPRGPEAEVLAEPGVGPAQRLRFEGAHANPARLASLKKSAVFKDADVLQECRQADAEWLGEFAHRCFPQAQARHHRTTCRIRERGECAVELGPLVCHVAKYARTSAGRQVTSSIGEVSGAESGRRLLRQRRTG